MRSSLQSPLPHWAFQATKLLFEVMFDTAEDATDHLAACPIVRESQTNVVAHPEQNHMPYATLQLRRWHPEIAIVANVQ